MSDTPIAAQAGSPLISRSLAGIVCVEAGMLLFVGQDAMMKSLLGPFSLWMLISVRAVVAVLVLVPLILMLGAPHRMLTPLWPLHLARAALFASGFSLFYTAFPFMGLAEVTTIFFAAPLITALIAALFLGERVGLHRSACLVIGFAGVVIAMNPTGDTFQWVAILPLICALTYAISQVIARQIGERETTLTLGLYTISLSGVLIVPMGYAVNQMLDLGPEFAHLRWEWSIPDAAGIVGLAVLGALGMAGYMLTSRAYQIASASLVAPFDYTYLPFAALLAYTAFGEVPSSHTLIGMALIIGSGLYLGYREARQLRPRASPLPTGEVAFVPSAPVGAVVHASDTRSASDEDRM